MPSHLFDSDREHQRTTGRWWCVSSALLRHSAGDRRERGPHRADTRSPRGRCWLISTLAPSHPRRAGNVASRRGRSAPFALLPRTALARRASFGRMDEWLKSLAWKASSPSRGSRVRISLLPPYTRSGTWAERFTSRFNCKFRSTKISIIDVIGETKWLE